MEFGLLVLRLVVGALFIGHGTQKLFGWFDGHGVEGTGGFMESLGYRPGKRYALLGGVAEAGGGLLLFLGLLTPLAAAAIIGMMINAIFAVHGLTAAQLALAGVESVIPMDEVVEAMVRIGRALPRSLR